jgi:pimeloyl-ACP methyl ester carboxylesterase
VIAVGDGPIPERLDVPVAGGSLAVYRLGREDPVALAVHGITSNSHAWLPVARALGDRASLAAVDLRGRGRSAELPGPYGAAAYVRDLLAVLDRLGLEQTVAVGHSLGAYIVARLAADHPERVRAAVLVDGGLTIPDALDVDPQTFIEGFLGPVLARLRERFPSREAYHDWWRAHPALAGGAVADERLIPFADHDLTGAAPELRSSVLEQAVRADADEVLQIGEAAHRLAVPATLLCAPRGLLDEPNPMQPLELVREWAAEDPDRRRAVQVPDTNHYTLILGEAGARAVAETVRGYL